MTIVSSMTDNYASKYILLLILWNIYCAVPGATPEQRLENALSSMQQHRPVRPGGMSLQQFQAVQEKRKQLWKKKVSTTEYYFTNLPCQQGQLLWQMSLVIYFKWPGVVSASFMYEITMSVLHISVSVKCVYT